MIVIALNEKLKQYTIIHHHLLQLELLVLLGEFCSHQIILITAFFAIKQMMQLISISVKLYHWINLLEKITRVS